MNIINKIVAIVLILTGMTPLILDGDATCLVFMLMLGIPLFFAKEEYTYYEDEEIK
jgi:hypothetical protein